MFRRALLFVPLCAMSAHAGYTVDNADCRKTITRLMEQESKAAGFHFGKYGEALLPTEHWDQAGPHSRVHDEGFSRALKVTTKEASKYDGGYENLFPRKSIAKVKRVLQSCAKEEDKEIAQCIKRWKEAGEGNDSPRIKACQNRNDSVGAVSVGKLTDGWDFSSGEWPGHYVTFGGCHYRNETGVMGRMFFLDSTAPGCPVRLVRELPTDRKKLPIEANFETCPARKGEKILYATEAVGAALGWPVYECDAERNAGYTCYKAKGGSAKNAWKKCETDEQVTPYIAIARKDCAKKKEQLKVAVSESLELCKRYEDDFAAVRKNRGSRVPTQDAAKGSIDVNGSVVK